MVERFNVYLVNLDPEPTDDAKNTRPAVVISPNEVNAYLDHVLIAPLTSGNAKYPTRIFTKFLNSERSVVLDQIRAVDKRRLVKNIGIIDRAAQKKITETLIEMFEE